MAVSQTSMINKALTLCGASPITSIDDDTNNARIASRVYEIALKDILSECAWNFAVTRTTLSVSAVDFAWDYADEAYTYVRPSDALRIIETSDPDSIWREEGDYILSDTASLGIKYVYYHTDPSKYPPKFVSAFIDKLCSDISYMIINDAKKGAAFFEKYEKVSLPKALAENAQTGKHQTLKDNAWEDAKYTNTHPEA